MLILIKLMWKHTWITRQHFCYLFLKTFSELRTSNTKIEAAEGIKGLLKGQLGVPQTVYPGIYCVLWGFLGIITHKYPQTIGLI